MMLCICILLLVLILGIWAFCKFCGELSREEEQRDKNFYIRPPYNNTCVCCGTTIPEGAHYCKKCFRKSEVVEE